MGPQEIKNAIIANWHRTLAERGITLRDATSVSGATPPSVFVGSYNYPKVFVGPMVPPVHGDTGIFDSPESWRGLTLDRIVGLRLDMVRGVKPIRVDAPPARYVEDLQEVAMSSSSSESDLAFDGPVANVPYVTGGGGGGGSDGGYGGGIGGSDGDGDDGGIGSGSGIGSGIGSGGGHLGDAAVSAPFGPVGTIRSVRFSGMSAPSRHIERAYYDRDMMAADAMMELYKSEIPISKIQRCLSIGMFGTNRKLVPTKWSITATDSVISSRLLRDVAEYETIDSYRVFWHEHLGNVFAVVLFPHMWAFELVEAWYAPAAHDERGSAAAANPAKAARGRAAFGSDWETLRLQRKPAETAGAYYAARLAVLEYLVRIRAQAGALVLREIRPEYAVPVGVWQVREGVRAAVRGAYAAADGLHDAVRRAASVTGVAPADWLGHGRIIRLARQSRLTDYV